MAAIDALRCVRNAPYRLTFPLKNTADALVSAAAGLASNVSVESGAFASTGGSVTEIGASGIYYLDLTALELTSTSSAYVYITSSDSTPFTTEIPFEPALETGEAAAATASSITLRAAASGVDDTYNGAQIEIIRGTGLGQSRTITDYTGSTQIANIDRVWLTNPDTTSVYKVSEVGVKMGADIDAHSNMLQINGNQAAAVLLALFSEGMATASSVNDASPSTTSWITASGLVATDDHYNNAICMFTSGTNIGLTRQIIDWDESLDTMTTNAFPVAPANGDTFVIYGKVF